MSHIPPDFVVTGDISSDIIPVTLSPLHKLNSITAADSFLRKTGHIGQEFSAWSGQAPYFGTGDVSMIQTAALLQPVSGVDVNKDNWVNTDFKYATVGGPNPSFASAYGTQLLSDLQDYREEIDLLASSHGRGRAPWTVSIELTKNYGEASASIVFSDTASSWNSNIISNSESDLGWGAKVTSSRYIPRGRNQGTQTVVKNLYLTSASVKSKLFVSEYLEGLPNHQFFTISKSVVGAINEIIQEPEFAEKGIANFRYTSGQLASLISSFDSAVGEFIGGGNDYNEMLDYIYNLDKNNIDYKDFGVNGSVMSGLKLIFRDTFLHEQRPHVWQSGYQDITGFKDFKSGAAVTGVLRVSDSINAGSGNFLTGSSRSIVVGSDNTLSNSDSSVIFGINHEVIGNPFITYPVTDSSDTVFVGVGDVGSTATHNSILGGSGNCIFLAENATVVGGAENTAGEDYTLAAGRKSKAYESGAFVLSDSEYYNKPSLGADTISLYFRNGVYIPTGHIYIKKDGEFQPVATLGSNVFTGHTYFGSGVTVSGASYFYGDTTMSGSLTVSGNSYVSGELWITGADGAPCQVTCGGGGGSFSYISLSGDLHVTGNSYLSGELWITGSNGAPCKVACSGDLAADFKWKCEDAWTCDIFGNRVGASGIYPESYYPYIDSFSRGGGCYMFGAAVGNSIGYAEGSFLVGGEINRITGNLWDSGGELSDAFIIGGRANLIADPLDITSSLSQSIYGSSRCEISGHNWTEESSSHIFCSEDVRLDTTFGRSLVLLSQNSTISGGRVTDDGNHSFLTDRGGTILLGGYGTKIGVFDNVRNSGSNAFIGVGVGASPPSGFSTLIAHRSGVFISGGPPWGGLYVGSGKQWKPVFGGGGGGGSFSCSDLNSCSVADLADGSITGLFLLSTVPSTPSTTVLANTYVTISGDTLISGDLTIAAGNDINISSGNLNLSGDLHVTGNSYLSGELWITGSNGAPCKVACSGDLAADFKWKCQDNWGCDIFGNHILQTGWDAIYPFITPDCQGQSNYIFGADLGTRIGGESVSKNIILGGSFNLISGYDGYDMEYGLIIGGASNILLTTSSKSTPQNPSSIIASRDTRVSGLCDEVNNYVNIYGSRDVGVSHPFSRNVIIGTEDLTISGGSTWVGSDHSYGGGSIVIGGHGINISPDHGNSGSNAFVGVGVGAQPPSGMSTLIAHAGGVFISGGLYTGSGSHWKMVGAGGGGGGGGSFSCSDLNSCSVADLADGSITGSFVTSTVSSPSPNTTIISNTNLTLQGDITVSGDIGMTGSLTVGSGLHVSGCLTSYACITDSTSTSLTMDDTYLGKIIHLTPASSATITLPSTFNGLKDGWQTTVMNMTTETIEFSAGGGTNLYSLGTKLTGQYQAATVYYNDTNWYAAGALS